MTSRLLFVGLALVAVQMVTTQQVTHTENLENCLTGDDESVGDSCGRFLASYRYSLNLPEMMGGARLIYNPSQGVDAFDVDYPKVQEEARGVLKKKLLLPILLLLKLKMKALQPLLLAIVGFKALKALILSKLAIGVVLVFVIMQLCKKMGMPMPMGMEPTPMPPGLPPMTGYGAPAPAPPPAPTNSYGEPPSSWDSGSSNGANGYHQRVWQDAHQIAYNGYSTAQNSATNSGSSDSPSSLTSKPLVASQY